MFQGHIDLDTATPVEASAIPDVLFERGRTDAIPLRREVAEMMSEVEIAAAQREARAWMTAH
jgi:hypothetical protein